MNLAVSNIAWDKKDDKEIYECLQDNNFSGLEIAPTRIFENNPYNHLAEAAMFSQQLNDKYNLSIVSMQSIWYGKSEKIFKNAGERKCLLQYTKKAIDFAASMNCGNIVFGCPKNRVVDNKGQYKIAIEFFSELGTYAYKNNVMIALEANPIIYNTNFLTTTEECLEFVKKIDNPGLAVNYDMGTVIHNNEELLDCSDMKYINHIHISEPFLNCIKLKDIHKNLVSLLIKSDYRKFISIEMKNLNDINILKKCIIDVGRLFKTL